MYTLNVILIYLTMKTLGRLASIKADKLKDAKVKHAKAKKVQAKKNDRAMGLQRSGSDLSTGRATYSTKTKKWSMKTK